MKKYGKFIEGGRAYELTEPLTPTIWQNRFFNDKILSEVDGALQGNSYILSGRSKTPMTTGFRGFYLHDHDTGKSYQLNRLLDNPSYKLHIHLGKVVLFGENDGIESEISVFTAKDARNEMWKVTLTNRTEAPKTISSFAATEITEYGSPMYGTCEYKNGAIYCYAYPYYVFFEDKEKAAKNIGYTYMVSDVEPYACEMSRHGFFGNWAKAGMPRAVAEGQCSGVKGEADNPYTVAMQHKVTLAPDESATFNFSIGCAVKEEEIIEYNNKFTTEFADEALREVEKYWEGVVNRYTVKTPDEDFNTFVNVWLKKQTKFSSYNSNVFEKGAPMRNELQDSLGFAFVYPEGEKRFMYTTLAREHRNGYIKQWYRVPATGLAQLEHCDGPAWIVIVLSILINQTGDISMLDDKIPYFDGGEGTLFEHIAAALDYAYNDKGERGLCLMRDGDWTDPMNGIGRLGKGESTWTTLAVIYGAQLFAPLCRAYGDLEMEKKAKKIAKELSDTVNAISWDEEAGYYYGGWHDDGKPFGYSGDGIIVLNSQSWAMLTGVATGERLRRTQEAVAKITTDLGTYVNYPPFKEYDARWGRISLKTPGTTENGAVYNHANMFKAAGDALAGDGDELYNTLYRASPANKAYPPEVRRQMPTFVPNYYYTNFESPNCARSSNRYRTGTCSWFAMDAVELLFGMKATVEGLRLEPTFPKAWDNLEASREFKDAKYHIIYKKDADGITVDGKKIEGTLLPYESGKSYEIICGI